MRTLGKMGVVALGLLLFSTLGARSLAAQGPTETPAVATAVVSAPPTATPTVNPDDPNRAGTIDGQPHTLPAHGVIWYAFDYSVNHLTGQRPLFLITLVNGNNSGVDFQVYAPENIGQWWNNKPTGRGTVQMLDCDTHEPSESGECPSPDLLWKGNFGADGTYWVRVVNNNDSKVNYLLTFVSLVPGT